MSVVDLHRCKIIMIIIIIFKVDPDLSISLLEKGKN